MKEIPIQDGLTVADRLQSLKTGQYDFMVYPDNFGVEETAKAMGIEIVTVGKPIKVNEIVVIVNKKEEKLAAEIDAALKKLTDDGTIAKLSEKWYHRNLLDNLKELIKALEEFENLQGFLEHVALVMDTDKAEQADQVSIMTLHAAKGLEYPIVFLPGWEDGLFPSQRSMDESGMKGLEEERRLAYVGITRARRRAYISFAANRLLYGNWQSSLPSRFIEELPKDEVDTVIDQGLQAGAHARATAAGQHQAVARDQHHLEEHEEVEGVAGQKRAANPHQLELPQRMEMPALAVPARADGVKLHQCHDPGHQHGVLQQIHLQLCKFAACSNAAGACDDEDRSQISHKHGQHMPLDAQGGLAHAVPTAHHGHGGGGHQKSHQPIADHACGGGLDELRRGGNRF